MRGRSNLIVHIVCFLVAICILSLSGCGIFNPPNRNSEGYYTRHFYSCGPAAVSYALGQFDEYHSWESISRKIQDNDNNWRAALSLLRKSAADITCPHEIVKVCGQYGYMVHEIKDVTKLDPSKHVALVLISSGLFSGWHWVCFPVVEHPAEFYGADTLVHQVYILTKKPSH